MRHKADTTAPAKNTGSRVGYTRVSTVAQTLEQQNAALDAAGVTKVFSDVMSGARDDRPGLAALMDYVREGDAVVVWKLDRLGRNMLHILQTVKKLTDRGVTLVSTSDGIDSSTPAGLRRLRSSQTLRTATYLGSRSRILIVSTPFYLAAPAD